MLTENLKKLRGNRTQEEIAKKLGISRARYSHYENGIREPDNKMLEELANLYNVTIDKLVGRKPQKEAHNDFKLEDSDDLPELTAKDERDIARDLENIIDGLEGHNNSYAQSNGQTIADMDDEDRELLILSLEQSMRLAKRIAKKKFTPKKYRNKE